MQLVVFLIARCVSSRTEPSRTRDRRHERKLQEWQQRRSPGLAAWAASAHSVSARLGCEHAARCNVLCDTLRLPLTCGVENRNRFHCPPVQGRIATFRTPSARPPNTSYPRVISSSEKSCVNNGRRLRRWFAANSIRRRMRSLPPGQSVDRI